MTAATLTAAHLPGAGAALGGDSLLARLDTSAATQTAGELGGIAGWAVGVMETLGILGAALLIFAENLFPPLPSEVILPLAGFTASLGTFSLLWVIVGTTVGSVLGAVLLYWLGRTIGADRLRSMADRLPLMHGGDIDRAIDFFARHGGKAVFFGRMVPLFRSLISIPAGVQRMPLPKFLLLSTAGSLIWNTVFVLAGYLLGQNWALVEQSAGVLQWVVIAAVVIAVTVFVARRVRAQRARTADGR
ncbi:DedA family protein [Nakamurella flava]|nr:DedA family protein [Nakamurella flava]